MRANRLDAVAESYLAYITEIRRNARRTIVDIRCTLNRVSEVMQRIRPETPLWRLALGDYLKWLELSREEGRSTESLAKELSHVRGLLNYTLRCGKAERNVLDGFNLADSGPARAPRVLDMEEMRRLVEACPRKTRLERRDRMIILLLYGCGLRTQELCDLNVADVDRERQEIAIQHGKGEHPRRLPVPEAVWVELLAYLCDRGGKRGALFRTVTHGRRLRAIDVSEVVKGVVSRAELQGTITPKTLRHTFATHLQASGVSLAVISSLMGHRGPSETGVYLHMLPGKDKAAVEKLEKKGEDL